MNQKLHILFFGLSIAMGQAFTSADDNWAQWRGPNRDGIAAPQALLNKWPSDGPKVAWSFSNAGTGYSSVSVEGNRLYTLGKRGDKNQLICLDTNSGSELWAASMGRAASGKDYSTGWGDGPRSTAAVEGDFVYALTDLGDLGCFQKTDGKQIWSVNLVSDFGGGIPKWGYSESVLIDGDRLVVTPGGANFLIGLDKRTGKKIWESDFSAGAQYVSVMKHTFSGVPVYLTAFDQGLVGIHCETGKLLFKNAATGNGTAVIPTPIVSDDLVYHSSAYKAGNAAVKISVKDGLLSAEQIYHQPKESMENHHGGYVLREGAIIGFSKALRGVWMAQDLKTGNVLWSKKLGESKSGSIALADGLVYCYDDQQGICYLAKATRTGLEEISRVKLPEQTATDRKQGAIWAHPVIANQKLFIRDQEKIFAFDIAQKNQ
ncbi:MAG: PQQ-binding-like beta-propeller repeat protein [Planctomycetota bacterium]|nr:PQQ-binding-like beta-propeller repeat protein [Planctomycetota bacterium]